jgi:hypothetical protein
VIDANVEWVDVNDERYERLRKREEFHCPLCNVIFALNADGDICAVQHQLDCLAR